MKHLLHDAAHDLTHLDGKIWRTLRALLIEPGRLTKDTGRAVAGCGSGRFACTSRFTFLHLLLLPNVAGPLALRFAAYRDASGKPHISIGTVAEK